VKSREIVENGRKGVLEEYNWEIEKRKLLRLY